MFTAAMIAVETANSTIQAHTISNLDFSLDLSRSLGMWSITSDE